MTGHRTRAPRKGKPGRIKAPSSPVVNPPASSPATDEALSDLPTVVDEAVKPELEPGVPAAAAQRSTSAGALPVPVIIPLSEWQICGEAVTGLAHRRNGLPCQDAVAWHSTTRPILALSDGAGSAVVSERGAVALVSGVSRFIVSMEDAVSPWLDGTAGNAREQAELWSRRLLTHARGLLDDLAHAERRNVREVRATLLLAMVGTVRSFWWQVGDGAIVAQSVDGLRVLTDTVKAKGEFANQTCFVDMASSVDVQFGLLSTSEIFGLALMSDGGAEKLVAHDGSRIAPRVGKWFDAVAQQMFSADKIALAYHEPEMWERTSLDDRSVVLTARSVALPIKRQVHDSDHSSTHGSPHLATDR